ncbi:hypothetical protein L596_024190 [Steinernema carpocapsae]|uniref:HTH psq-type domain-containing protein n=1 Tax=Steinernema carpocapsae TaxID=34508 RepID=A0A4U5MG24_STECR|nr:hypothetical protein L596_024190 [Steinernema carpocapsae]
MAAATVLCPVPLPPPVPTSSASSSSSEDSDPLVSATVSPEGHGSASSESSPNRRKKKPYKELTLEEKVQLIRLAEENSGMSQASIAERYAIAKSNVCRILQRKAEYLRAFETFAGSRKRKLRGDSAVGSDAAPQPKNPHPSQLPQPPLHHPVAIHPAENQPRPAVLRPALHRPLQVLTEPQIVDSNCNETLRAHMYKQHQISRIFMCRCCNWAFPDKTSLHMHMQAKEEGKNISVPVIGKGHAPNTASFSSANGGPFGSSQASSGNPSATNLQNPFIPLQLHTLSGLPPHQPLALGEHNAAASLFPQLSAMVPPNSEDLMTKLRDRFLINSMLNNAAGAAGFPLANWLANFPNVDASGVGKLGGSLDLRFGKADDDDSSEKEIKVDHEGENEDDELKVTTTDSHIDVVKDSDKDSECADELRNHSESPMEHSTSSNSEGSPSISALRNAIKSSVLPYMNISADSDGQVAQGSDVSHVSPTETNSSVSPSGTGCYDCTLNKEKLEETQNRCRFLEDRTATLQTDALRFSTRLSASEVSKQQHEQEMASLRSRLEVVQQRLGQVQEKTVAFIRGADLSNPAAISSLLNEVLQATLLQ